MENGHLITHFPLPLKAQELALSEQWAELDKLMGEVIKEQLFPYLQQFKSFRSIEHMLALRSGDNAEEEDGIWHDDGSRILAFSWSLNFFDLPQGGTLGIRRKGSLDAVELGPYPAGTLIVFQTGQDGFEHRTAKVTQGKRLVCAGWCS